MSLCRRRAWHAGLSYWAGISDVNSVSIGVEHVNTGYRWRDDHPIEGTVAVPGSSELWYPFNAEQVAASAELCAAIVRRQGIKPRWVVAHSDVAVGRKSDPGPLFPWRTLAEAGVGVWVPPGGEHGHAGVAVDETGVHARSLLRRIGYAVDEPKLAAPMTGATVEASSSEADYLRPAVRAFQLHWRPGNISGDVDAETLATMIDVVRVLEV